MNRLARSSWLIALLLFSTGCNLRLVSPFATVTPTKPPVIALPTSTASVPPLATATSEAATAVPTDTPLSPATSIPTPTPVPPTPVPPTPVPPTPLPPTPVPAAPGTEPVLIQFAPGATSAVVSGWVRKGDMARYVLRASVGQRMVVVVDSPAWDVFLTLIAPDAGLLKSYVDRQADWDGILPMGGDYQLQVVPTGQDTGYTMRATVYAPIHFAPGGTSATMSSPVQRMWSQGAEVVGGYVVRASAGQTMDVVIRSPNGNILLTVYGADGVPLKRYIDDRAEWRGTLHATQDYFIQLVSVGPDPYFTLVVTIPPLGETVVQPTPIPIFFEPGATHATVAGYLSPGHSQRYTLRASGGQRIEARAWPQGTMGIAVRGADGSTWSAQPWEEALVIPSLPATQEYEITLSLPPSAGQTVDYVMQVVIPAL